jgi:hypothetical protein
MVFGGKCDYAGPCLVQANVMISNVSIQLRCTTHQPPPNAVSVNDRHQDEASRGCLLPRSRSSTFVTFDTLLN